MLLIVGRVLVSRNTEKILQVVRSPSPPGVNADWRFCPSSKFKKKGGGEEGGEEGNDSNLFRSLLQCSQ